MTVLEEICSRINHAEGYYEFVFHVADRRAVEALFDHLQMLYDIHNKPDQPALRILLNFSNGVTPPIRQVGVQVQRFRKHNPERIHPRMVILYANAFMQMTTDVLVRTFSSRQTQIRIMAPTRRADAIEWLLKD